MTRDVQVTQRSAKQGGLVLCKRELAVGGFCDLLKRTYLLHCLDDELISVVLSIVCMCIYVCKYTPVPTEVCSII